MYDVECGTVVDDDVTEVVEIIGELNDVFGRITAGSIELGLL